MSPSAVWRQLDDFLTAAAPFDCGGFGQVRASTAPSACLLLDWLGAARDRVTAMMIVDTCVHILLFAWTLVIDDQRMHICLLT